MSRYPPPEYRGPPRERSRSPSRFSDRRPSTTALDSRPGPPPRAASDAPRGPRSQFDGPRPPPLGRLESASGPRPGYTSLRDAPPLSGGDRGRPYRERDYDRRDRPPSRERSPVRGIRDARDFPPRDLDDGRARRESRDGPLSAGSNFSDSQPPGPSQFRGGFGRGRGRGDFSYRGGRGDLIRRDRQERSPSRWTPREHSRDSRDERRFERREDDRRPPDWLDRDRDRDSDRLRRDQPPPRLDTRPSNESINSTSALYQSSQEPAINPERAALIAKSDPPARRSSVQLEPLSAREARREQPETPSYLNGRAETTAKRYETRDSSPPTQAPAVPAFSFLPPSAPAAPSTASTQVKAPQGPKPPASPSNDLQQPDEKVDDQPKPEAPVDAPLAPKAQLASPPAAAPKAPRALENEDAFESAAVNRLQPSRSSESLQGQNTIPTGPANPRADTKLQRFRRPSHSPAPASTLPNLIQPVSPRQPGRFSELGAPTGPRASRVSPRQPSISPRPTFASPRLDVSVLQAAPSGPRAQTPPPSAPSGPRGYSVSPKAAPFAPTAPKANRIPPLAPRGPDRVPPAAPGRALDRLNAPQSWAPPSAPRSNNQWNQWRKPGALGWDNKSVPAKRDFTGQEKGGNDDTLLSVEIASSSRIKTGDVPRHTVDASFASTTHAADDMRVDPQPLRRQTSLISGHSAAQSFFGKPVGGPDDDENDDNDDTGMSEMEPELASSSEEDESDTEDANGVALLNAKFERKKRQLEAQMVDISSRHYRATTPLESIARLARISAQDLQRIIEQREQEMDIDSPVTNQRMPTTTTRSSDSGDSNEVVTPQDDSLLRINIRGSDESMEMMQRIRKPSPEPISLPYLVKDGRSLFHDNNAFRDSQKRQEDTTEISDALEQDMNDQEDDAEEDEDKFANAFRQWREDCEDLDRTREEQEKLVRQQSIEPGPEPDAPVLPQLNPFEGRRLHKYSSEYMFEQVLKESEETARIERERQEREQMKNQADMKKEAIIPNQMTSEEERRGRFRDINRLRDPDALIAVFSYEPPVDDFTENEQQIFIAAFRETPKKWGEIASLLLGRTYEDCIRHYYANKWDSRFRDNKNKKHKGVRRGRGGARGPRGRASGLMADLQLQDYQLENMSEKGRPRRAAAPTNFAEKEAEAKANLVGPSPNKKPGTLLKGDANGDAASEKPGKRQKRTGDKQGTGRKKGGQPWQNLAAVPQGAFGKENLHNMGGKTDAARAQKLEEASLLTGLHAGQHGMINPDGQVYYAPEGYVHSIPGADDLDRSKTGAQVPQQKQSASSYWSVPEQTDFVKYIGHFGRDFAAIASHMGTKTQTMIKNHFQRQIDSGSKPELQKAADEADARRLRGEDLGPPPAPTPIIKRKYENPQAPPSRPLAPHAEAMEVDDPALGARSQPKHASPPQFQSRPQFAGPPPTTQIPATRVVPSPMAAAAHPASAQLQQNARQPQHTLGSRPFLSETRPESRQGHQPDIGFRAMQEPLRGQLSQVARSHVDAQDPQYLRNLAQEQERALRMQRQYSDDQGEQPQRQNSQHRYQAQGSPLNRPLHQPPNRKPEERSLTPPVQTRAPFPGFTRPPSLGSSSFAPLSGQTPFTTIAGRSPFSGSPKREDFRPGSVPVGPPGQTSTPVSHPEPPKRSNVLSLLNNDEPDEPKPLKRDSLPSAAQRTESPISQAHPHSTSAPSVPSIRREPSFGQPSVLQSHFQRGPFGSQSSAPSPGQSSLKHEPISATQAPPSDWASAARGIGQTSQPPSAAPVLERDVRGYYQHNHRTSLLGPLGQTRAVPSPPPTLLGGIGHSRTPSLTTPTTQPGREQTRSSLAGPPPPGSHQPSQPLQPNPYGSQQPTSFSHQPSRETQNQLQHSHNSSLGNPFPSLHHRGMSRDDELRNRDEILRHNEQALRERRERQDHEMRWRRQEISDAERRRDEELFRRQQEQERQHRPPSVIQPPPFGDPSFGQRGGLDLRAQARMESEALMHEERQRQEERRRREEQIAREEELRRRQDETLNGFRRTPLGGAGFGIPPPPRR